MAFDPKGRFLGVGDSVSFSLWHTRTWKRVWNRPQERVLSTAFSPQNDIVLVGDVKSTEALKIEDGSVYYALPDLKDPGSYAAVYDRTGSLIAVGGQRFLEIRDGLTGQRLLSPEPRDNHVLAVAFSTDGDMLASAGTEKVIRLWSMVDSGRLLREIEGHPGHICGLSFSADGQMLASWDRKGTLRLWDTKTWAGIGEISTESIGRWPSNAPFHPTLPFLARLGSAEESRFTVLVQRLDPKLLLAEAKSDSITYTSAKIVLVGDSGVGKSGLGYRLASGSFKEHSSTHGQQFWLMEELGVTRTDGTEGEAILWDLAGQPDYRLIHALFLDDADVALVLFDPTRDDDPLHGVDYWLRQLCGPDGRPRCPVILVAARSDRGSARMATGEISDYCARNGIVAHIETSALSGAGLPDLVAAMRDVVDWDAKPATVTTSTFKWIKDAVLRLKERKDEAQRPEVILTPATLGDRLRRDAVPRSFSEDELLAAVGHLANHGYVAVLRTSDGESRVLLTPELLNNVAASIVLEARRNPKDLGSLEESRVLSGGYAFPELEGLSTAERDVLLDSAVAMFLQHNVCFRETNPLTSRVYLVFPGLINLRPPARSDDRSVEEGVAYTVSGSTENVYASLVVLLGYTDVFTRTNQWQNRAQYAFGDGQICGLRLEAERDGELDFVLYFGVDVGQPLRTLFQSLFESFLAGRDLTIQRFEPVICSRRHRLNRSVVREHIDEGAEDIYCTRCGERLALPRTDAQIQLNQGQAADLDTQRRTVFRRSRFEQVLFKLHTYISDDPAEQPTCFISYAWGDKDQERWIERELAADLGKAGVTVILDRWDNAKIGASISRFVERVATADKVIVVGTPRYRTKYDNDEAGHVVAAEGDLIGMRMIRSEREKETILPVILEGSPETALPIIVQRRTYGDFRDPEHYFLTLFDLILSIHGISRRDPVVADLRSSVEVDGPFRNK